MERMSGGGRITPTAAVCVASVTEPAATLVDASARPSAAACETTSSIRTTQHHYLQEQQAVLLYCDSQVHSLGEAAWRLLLEHSNTPVEH